MTSGLLSAHRKFWLGLLLAALAFNLCGLGYLQFQLWKNADQGGQPHASVQGWGLTDLALEHHRLRTQLERTLVRHDAPEDMAGLHLRYSILLSRYRQSQQAIDNTPSVPDMPVRHHLAELHRLFAQSSLYFNSGLQAPAYDETELTRLKQRLETTTPLVLELLEWSKREQNARNSAQLGTIQRLALLAGGASALLGLLTAVLGLLARRQVRALRLSELELHTARKAFEQTTQHALMTNPDNRPAFELDMAQAREQTDENRFQQHRDQVDAVQKLQKLINDDKLCLHWQRIVPLQNSGSGKIKGEVLLRLQETEQLLPGNFLPVAERFGLATTLDRWVLSHVIDWIEQHLPQLEHLDSLSVNLSGQSISDPTFQQFAQDRLANLTFPANKIILEVTETAAICNLQASLAFFNALRQLGIGISLDDFGRGMSSFGYLKHLPVDYLKIDGQFMRQLVSNGVDQVTVRAICEVARATGKQTVAEWVDNGEVAAILRRFGVDHGQGYFWHQPEPLETLLAFRSDAPK